MKKRQRLKSKRKGITALVVLIVIVLFISSIALMALGLDCRILAIRNASNVVARCAADAGLTKAIYEMNQKLEVEPWDDSTLPQATDEVLPNCNATFSYIVTGDASNGYKIESVGKSLEAEKKVSCTLELISPFESAIFVQEDLILKPGTLVDGYNSQDSGDSSSSTDSDIDVKIGTNSTTEDSVILGNDVVVDGDVVVGVNGDVASVIEDHGATTGDRYAITSEVVFPEITVPTLLYKGCGIQAHGTTVTIGPIDSGEYDGIDLKNATDPGVLEIAGGEVVLHITENIDLGQSCEIVVSEGSSLVIYLDGNLIGDNDAGINNLNDPENFKLYGTGEEQSIDLKAKGNFYGAVYAPNADITVNAGGDVYGAFVGSNFELKSGGNFHYDGALADTSLNDQAVRFVVTNWHEE